MLATTAAAMLTYDNRDMTEMVKYLEAERDALRQRIKELERELREQRQTTVAPA